MMSRQHPPTTEPVAPQLETPNRHERRKAAALARRPLIQLCPAPTNKKASRKKGGQ